MAVRPIDGNDFMRQLTLDTSKGHYGEFMDGSEVAYTSREIAKFVEDMPTLTLPNEPLTPKQLREMNEPVWCSCKPIEGGNGYWCLCRYGKIVTPSGNIFDVDKIPHRMFYRRPLEGEADA